MVMCLSYVAVAVARQRLPARGWRVRPARQRLGRRVSTSTCQVKHSSRVQVTGEGTLYLFKATQVACLKGLAPTHCAQWHKTRRHKMAASRCP